MKASIFPKDPKGKVRRVNNTDVVDILKEAFGEDCEVFINEREYFLLDGEQVKEFIKIDQTDRIRNRSKHNLFDFSRILIGRALESALRDGVDAGIAIGEVRGIITVDGKDKPKMASHVVFITKMKTAHRVFLLDPKTDEYYLPNRKSTYQSVFI